ncbi:hypothetical protein ACFLQN_03510 [Candidatus Aenigmatarchaeota archaeon]
MAFSFMMRNLFYVLVTSLIIFLVIVYITGRIETSFISTPGITYG